MQFVLDTKSGVPFYRQIIDQVRFAIANGKLKSGDQLPTVRALAAELQINLNTVSKAYNELELKGIVITQQGTGTFISSKEIKMSKAERAKKTKEICEEFVAIASAYGIDKEELVENLTNNKGKK